MATRLENTVIRETSQVVDEKNIIIKITPEQKVILKLKGEKKQFEISIMELYQKLTNTEPQPEREMPTGPTETIRVPQKGDTSKKISLNDFRSLYLTSANFDLPTKMKLEAITARIINGE